MTQTTILDQCKRYLEAISAETIAQLELEKTPSNSTTIDKKISDQKNYLEKSTKALDRGYCFGFSLCDGAMELTGKLNWWENALVEFYHWDGKKNSLDEEVLIPDSIQNKKITRRELFKRIINYIISTFADEKTFEEFLPKSISQLNILQPDAHVLIKNNQEIKQSYFEIIDDQGQIQTIKKENKIAGNFTNADLDSILSEQTISGTVCLILSIDHAMRLSYANNLWTLYDPEYSHKETKTMRFTGTKKEVIAEIFACLHTHSMAIQVAAFNEDKKMEFPTYDKLMKESPEKLLEVHGLHIIAWDTSKAIFKLVELAKDNTIQGNKIRSAIAKSLLIRDSQNPLHKKKR